MGSCVNDWAFPRDREHRRSKRLWRSRAQSLGSGWVSGVWELAEWKDGAGSWSFRSGAQNIWVISTYIAHEAMEECGKQKNLYQVALVRPKLTKCSWSSSEGCFSPRTLDWFVLFNVMSPRGAQMSVSASGWVPQVTLLYDTAQNQNFYSHQIHIHRFSWF